MPGIIRTSFFSRRPFILGHTRGLLCYSKLPILISTHLLTWNWWTLFPWILGPVTLKNCPPQVDSLIRLCNKPVHINRFQGALENERKVWRRRWWIHTYVPVPCDISDRPPRVCISPAWSFLVGAGKILEWPRHVYFSNSKRRKNKPPPAAAKNICTCNTKN